MRISNNMMVFNFLRSLNASQASMKKLEEQLSDEQIVHRPSDDPIRAYRGLRFNVDLTMNEQYTQNAKDAEQWLNQSDEAIQDLSSTVISVKELLTKATSANPTLAYQAAAKELDGLINHAIDLANTQLGDHYIFGGQRDKIQGAKAFERVTIAGVDRVVYNGDNNKICMPIQPGSVDPSRDSVNITGEELFGATTIVGNQKVSAFFDKLFQIKAELESATPNNTTLSNMQGIVNSLHDQVLVSATEVGARMANNEMVQNMMEKQYTTIAKNYDANSHLDVAKATIEFKNVEKIYNQALAIGARTLPPSLVDFLK